MNAQEIELKVDRLVYQGRSYRNPESMKRVFLQAVEDLEFEERWSNRGIVIHTEDGPILFCHFSFKMLDPFLRDGERLVCCHPKDLTEASRSVHLLPDAPGVITSRAQVWENTLYLLVEA